jgi:hypothetical protein
MQGRRIFAVRLPERKRQSVALFQICVTYIQLRIMRDRKSATHYAWHENNDA